MKSTPLLILLGLMALAIAAATALLGRPAPFTAPSGLGQKAFPDFKSEAIHHIRIERQGQVIELTRQSRGYWEIPALDGFPAGDFVNSLPDTIGNLQVDDRLPATASAMEACRLTPETGTRLTMRSEDRAIAVDLLIGCTGPNQRGGWFRQPDGREALLTFDSRISQLPLYYGPWTRLQMGLIDPNGMILELEKPGIDRITLIQYREKWILQSLRRDAEGRELEEADAERQRFIVAYGSNMICDGVFPAATAPESLGFGPGGAVLTARSHDGNIAARVDFGVPLNRPDLIGSDGQAVGEPVIPMRIAFTFGGQARQDEYAAWFNGKAAQRLFWLKQSTFKNLFVPRNELTIPKPNLPPAAP